MIFHPELLYGFHGSYYEKAYYSPFLDRNAPLYLLHSNNAWTEDAFQQLRWIANHADETDPAARLKIQHVLQSVWALFAEKLPKEIQGTAAQHTRKIFDLIGYLNENYAEKLSLTVFAHSVSLSRNECCRYFKQMMNMTITEYLLEYRLSKAAGLWETSGLSISEIAAKTGFCDVSYFIKEFKEKTRITPSAYRKQYINGRAE